MRRKALFIAYGALLAAVSVVLKLYGIPISEGGFLKDLNLSPVVIMFSGITLGPVGGALVGAITDIMASLIRPLGAYVPWFTITSALMGLIPGLFFLKRKKKKLTLTETDQPVVAPSVHVKRIILSGRSSPHAWQVTE